MMVRKQGDWLAAKVGDELVMMSAEKGNYIGLSEVGARIWELIETPKDIDAVCTELQSEYAVTPEACRAEGRRAKAGGIFSVPLSFELPRPGITRRTAQRSSDFPPPTFALVLSDSRFGAAAIILFTATDQVYSVVPKSLIPSSRVPVPRTGTPGTKEPWNQEPIRRSLG